MSSQRSLYSIGDHPAKRKRNAPIATSTSTFTNTLTSLLAQSSSQTSSRSTTRTRLSQQPKDKRDNIFTKHNRNILQRSQADLLIPGEQQAHSTTSPDLDESEYHRSKRRMEEKARLYSAMKRGDYVPTPGGPDRESEGLVDFDRKWAADEKKSYSDQSDSDSDVENSSSALPQDQASEVTIEDEFGRSRTVTRREANKLARQQAASAYATEQLASFSARPTERPSNLILGDTVQSGAFRPTDAFVMESLAGKRDRSLTPPPETHYDATKEIRTKGTGFYQFSRDEDSRQREMAALNAERRETEQAKCKTNAPSMYGEEASNDAIKRHATMHKASGVVPYPFSPVDTKPDVYKESRQEETQKRQDNQSHQSQRLRFHPTTEHYNAYIPSTAKPTEAADNFLNDLEQDLDRG